MSELIRRCAKMSNKTCGECKYFVTSNYLDVCVVECETRRADSVCKHCDVFKPRVVTNGDVIRQMSNAELADRLGIHAMCDFCPAERADCGRGKKEIKYCREAWLAWLNAPAESEKESEGGR
jgi:hypothetical protein